MVKQVFDVEQFWKVIIYYDVDGDFFFPIFKELEGIDFFVDTINHIQRQLQRGEIKGVTCSNGYYHTSIVIFNKHKDRLDYLNSLVHEAEHIKQAMLEAYKVEDAGEPPAYTIGYLVMRMWRVFKEFL